MSTVPGASGPALPSPEDLKEYDAAHPGLGRQIIEMVQAEQRHLHDMERAEVSLSRRGQLFGFIIAISFLVASAVLVALGYSVAGTIIGSVDLVALTTVFVVGRRSQDNSPGPRQAESTDRLIRELRRAQSSGTKASKTRKKKQPTSLEIERAANSLTSEPPPPRVSAEKPQNIAVPTDGPNAVGAGIGETPSAGKVDLPAAESTSPDILPDVVEQRPQLTNEDIRVYRKLYDDPDWGSNENRTPLT
jgi:uncharacterized membrane protein